MKNWILATLAVAATAFTHTITENMTLQFFTAEFIWNGFFINFRISYTNLGWLFGFERGAFEFIWAYEPEAREFVWQFIRDIFNASILITMPYWDNKNKRIYKNKFQHFPFHLVDPSPWPILLSFSLLNLTVGAVAYMHGFSYGGTILTLGFLLTTYGMILWFRDVVIEASYLGHHTTEVKHGLMLGVLLFIVSEVFAFLSVFWAFFHSSLSPSIEIGGSWPPLGITPLDPFAIPLLNTFLLLSSGAFITFGHHALIAGNRKAAIDGVILTIILAVIFTALQYFEYSEAGFTISDGVYGSAFYASTGLHGFHVIIGTIFIAVALMRIINYQLTTNHHNGFEASIVYWHFVDVVWLFLFVAVYFWGNT